MSFLYHKPDSVRELLSTQYGSDLSPEMFGRRDEFQQDHLTEQGMALLRWLGTGRVSRFPEDVRWLEFVDPIAVCGFGADYDLLRGGVPHELQNDLDAFYGPFRCNTFLPDGPASDEFDCRILGAIGVQFIYSPGQCYRLWRLGSEHPLIALYAELMAKRESLDERLRNRLFELLSDAEWRDLLCRYDSMHHELRAAYFHSHVTRNHLIVTNRW